MNGDINQWPEMKARSAKNDNSLSNFTPGYSENTNYHSNNNEWNYFSVINSANHGSKSIFSQGLASRSRAHEKDEYMDLMQKQIDEQRRKRERDAVKRQITQQQMLKLVSTLLLH